MDDATLNVRAAVERMLRQARGLFWHELHMYAEDRANTEVDGAAMVYKLGCVLVTAWSSDKKVELWRQDS